MNPFLNLPFRHDLQELKRRTKSQKISVVVPFQNFFRNTSLDKAVKKKNEQKKLLKDGCAIVHEIFNFYNKGKKKRRKGFQFANAKAGNKWLKKDFLSLVPAYCEIMKLLRV